MAVVRGLVTLIAGCLATGCAILTPLPDDSTLDQRLAAFPTENLPLRGRTVIYWDKHQIPFIEAEQDADAAFALGLVHAHLRLGQMEIGRRLSQGRVSQMSGPFELDTDRALRILNLTKAVPEIEAALPPETRAWLDAFVAGINHYQANVEILPHEHRVLGLDREPWTVADILKIVRMAGAEANWSVWLSILPLRDREDWPELWAQLVRSGSDSVVSFDGMELDDLDEILTGFRHSGSNAVAIAASRSKTGAALMAGDPHLSYLLPNLWLLAGVKSPSTHVVGVMPAGFPFFGLGRNPSIAWAGTNMRSASSDLYDISELSPEEITTRTESIDVRWWFDRSVDIRETKWGPVLSDIPQLDDYSGPELALRWVGYAPSDEVTAMLKSNRATNFAEFRAAFASYAVVGMNMSYADVNGNIGQVKAVRVPRRDSEPPSDLVLDPALREPDWQTLFDASNLPFAYNPASGFIATANNRPAEGQVSVGYFFSADDRIVRLNELLQGSHKLGVDDLKKLQRDVYMKSSVAMRDAFVEKIAAFGIDQDVDDTERLVLTLMAGWDGHYSVDSRGAVAFELFRNGYTEALYGPTFSRLQPSEVVNVIGTGHKIRYDLERKDRSDLEPALVSALASAAERIDQYADWGTMHRLELTHPFATIPFVGGRYRFSDAPMGGSIHTVMKATHQRISSRHQARIGANARFISDLSDPDTNYAVLAGGQDGWFNSSTFDDQVSLFLAGDYVQMPLRLETVRARAARTMTLLP